MSAANFAGRLKELRVGAGLTQEGLATRAKLSKAGIADLEQGRREPAWATVIALAEALGVTCQAFLEEPTVTEKAKPGRPRQTPDAPPLEQVANRERKRREPRPKPKPQQK